MKKARLLILFITLCCISNVYSQSTDNEIIKDCLWSKILNTPKNKRIPTGLALSGGGARAFAHVGVIDVLDSVSFPIDYIAGTSMGAVIGGLYSSGIRIDEIWNFGREIEKLKISKDFSKIKVLNLILTEQLIEPTYIRKFIDDKFKGKNFNDLKIPFACVAMDIKTGEKIIFYDGDTDIAIKASVNLPGIFKPIKFKHRYLVDGGVVDFLPVDALKEMGAKWILSSVTENTLNEMPDNVLTTLMQVIDIRGYLLSLKSKEESDFIIYPPINNIKATEFNMCIKAAENAVKETYNKIDKIQEKYIIENIKEFSDIL